MHPTPSRRRRPGRAVDLIAGVALAALVALTAAVASTAVGISSATAAGTVPAPQLSIAIDDGQTTAAGGDSLTYTISVKNLGTTPVDGLQVTQTMPAGLTFVSADGGGSVDAAGVRWTVDLGAAGDVTLHTTTTVSSPPTDVLRLASVACASTDAAGPPIVCASHSDLLPAGAAELEAAGAPGPTSSASSGRPWYLGGVIVAVVVVGVGALLVALRRRSMRRA